MGDLRPAHGLLANRPPPALCAADTAYDSNGLCHFLLGPGATPVIPNNPIRTTPQPFDARAHKARNIIERTIGRLKDRHRIQADTTSSPPTSPRPSLSPPSSSDVPS